MSQDTTETIQELINKTKELRCGPSIEIQAERSINKRLEQFVLVGKLISTRSFKQPIVKACLVRSWGVNEGELGVEELDRNIFLFTYCNQRDREKALEGTPWSVADNHLVLKEWDPDLHWSEIEFTQTVFWVHVIGLPPNLITPETAKVVGEQFEGLAMAEDQLEATISGGVSMKIKVKVNTTRPLPTGFVLKRGELAPKQISFKYERLPEFCYFCGRLGHTSRSCQEEGTKQRSLLSCLPTHQLPYGDWMRKVSRNAGRAMKRQNRQGKCKDATTYGKAKWGGISSGNWPGRICDRAATGGSEDAITGGDGAAGTR